MSTHVAKTPAGDGLFNESQGGKLPEERAEDLNATVDAKGLFLRKRARPDMQPMIAVLRALVKGLNEADWGEPIRLMKRLNGAKKLRPTLSAGSLRCIKWPVDASFAVHPNCKSHAGAAASFEDGKGAA